MFFQRIDLCTIILTFSRILIKFPFLFLVLTSSQHIPVRAFANTAWQASLWYRLRNKYVTNIIFSYIIIFVKTFSVYYN